MSRLEQHAAVTTVLDQSDPRFALGRGAGEIRSRRAFLPAKGLFEDGKRHLVMRQPIALRCPARLLRGMCDDAVPWQTSLALAERLESRNVAVILLKYGDHRLSSESDLARLGRTLDELVGEQPL
jgi:hypothetical protein